MELAFYSIGYARTYKKPSGGLLHALYCSGGSHTEAVPGPFGVGHKGQRLRPPHWSYLLMTVQLLGLAAFADGGAKSGGKGWITSGSPVPAGC